MQSLAEQPFEAEGGSSAWFRTDSPTTPSPVQTEHPRSHGSGTAFLPASLGLLPDLPRPTRSPSHPLLVGSSFAHTNSVSSVPAASSHSSLRSIRGLKDETAPPASRLDRIRSLPRLSPPRLAGASTSANTSAGSTEPNERAISEDLCSRIDSWTLEDGRLVLCEPDFDESLSVSIRQRAISIDSTATFDSAYTSSSSASLHSSTDDSLLALSEAEAEDEFPLSAFEASFTSKNYQPFFVFSSNGLDGQGWAGEQGGAVTASDSDRLGLPRPADPRYIARSSFPAPPSTTPSPILMQEQREALSSNFLLGPSLRQRRDMGSLTALELLESFEVPPSAVTTPLPLPLYDAPYPSLSGGFQRPYIPRLSCPAALGSSYPPAPPPSHPSAAAAGPALSTSSSAPTYSHHSYSARPPRPDYCASSYAPYLHPHPHPHAPGHFHTHPHPRPAAPPGPSPHNKKGELYKTELCRSWTESGQCRYERRCQFAHGIHELKPLRKAARGPAHDWGAEPCYCACFDVELMAGNTGEQYYTRPLDY